MRINGFLIVTSLSIKDAQKVLRFCVILGFLLDVPKSGKHRTLSVIEILGCSGLAVF